VRPVNWKENGQRLLITPVADPENCEKGAEDNVSAPSSFITNAHNELCTGKGCLLKKKSEPIGGSRTAFPV